MDDITLAKNQIQARLSGAHIPDLIRLDDQYSKLSCAIDRVVKEQKGSSLVLMGPRGTGKTIVGFIIYEINFFFTNTYILLVDE